MSLRPIPTSLILKLANKCNLACPYCYWFKDGTPHGKPPKLTDEAYEHRLINLQSLWAREEVNKFFILLHGGEPLLYGITATERLLSSLDALATQNNVDLSIAVQSNGVLINKAWIELFARFGVGIGISVDGPPSIQDASRPFVDGSGSSAVVERAIMRMTAAGLSPGI